MRPGGGPVALGVVSLARHPHASGRRALAETADGHELAALDEVDDVGAHARARDERRGPGELCPREQDLPHVVVGSPRLDVQVVAVVPPRDETEVVHGGEGGSTGPHDDPHVTAQHLQPRGVAGLRPLVGVEHDVAVGAQGRQERGVDPVEVAAVRDDEDAPPP